MAAQHPNSSEEEFMSKHPVELLLDAVRLLKELTEDEDEECNIDHDGNCQTHNLHEEPCAVRRGREFVSQYEENYGEV